MGTGKSTFVRHLLEALRVVGQPQGSPTFSIAHEYLTAIGKVIHIDLFRLETVEDVEMAGLLDYFQENPDGPVVFIEWGSRISNLMTSQSGIRAAIIEMSLGSDPSRFRNIEFK